jgi:peptidoglycan/xylan/chitin deacetylase (PgdA/CDA1 family)
MNRPRILLLSSTRPSRAWRIAERISSEMPDFEICGIVQHGLRQLPWVQRLIAAGNIDGIDFRARVPSKANLWFRKILGELVHWVLWCAHGCPRGVRAMRAKGKFTDKDLAERCRRFGWPFLLVDRGNDENITELARRQHPDLAIVLGQPSLSRELLDLPAYGLARIVVRGVSDPVTARLPEVTELKVEHFAKGSGSACTLGSLSIPSQTHDGLLGMTLKNDLIADDLLVQAAKGLKKGSQAQASKEVKEWMQKILSPYLDQFALPSRQSSAAQRAPFCQRYRSLIKLCLQSLLCSPWMMGRNWYRCLRGRYPVLILTHHLVSDHPHRMGIPTEELWRRIKFLQRHYRIVSLSEACDLLRSGSVKVPTVVLTFDDGYCDNFITLRAVAEEATAPVALFVATQLVEVHQEFQHDLESGTRGFFPLTWDQIQYWSLRGAEFGSHTRTHFDCGAPDRARLEQEVVGSKSDLEVRLGQPVRFFAFPFGKPENISPEALELVASTYAFFDSSLGGENLPRNGTCQQHLFRKNLYSDPWELELELQSVFDLVQKCKLRLKQPFRSWHPQAVVGKS